MSFQDFVGQEPLVRMLQKSLRTGRVAHAYLFTGPRGMGKATLARELAKALNCAGERGDACDRCSSCRRITAGHHPDLLRVQPDGSAVKIEQVRALQKALWMRPVEGAYRVGIVEEADKMTAEAANSFLKILEEPPPHAVLILLAEQPYGLLPAVTSRCQVLAFRRVATPALESFLSARLRLDRGDARLLAAMAGGNPGRALALHGSGTWEPVRQRVLELPDRLGAAEGGELLSIPEPGKEQWATYLELLLLYFRDLLLYRLGVREVMSHLDREHMIKVRAEGLSLPQILEALSLIHRTIDAARKNANHQLAWEAMLFKLWPLFRSGIMDSR